MPVMKKWGGCGETYLARSTHETSKSPEAPLKDPRKPKESGLAHPIEKKK
jgi:hypothetical protein